MSRMLKGLLGWMAGTAVVFALFSAASLAALTALAAVPVERGAAGASMVALADTGASSTSNSGVVSTGAAPVLAALPAAAEPDALVPPPMPAPPSAVAAERAVVLRHLLIQDCGSCHGLTLGGGLGPPLLRQSLTDKPVPYLVAVILHGRPGTAMPPWSAFLTAPEGEWLARELKGENP